MWLSLVYLSVEAEKVDFKKNGTAITTAAPKYKRSTWNKMELNPCLPNSDSTPTVRCPFSFELKQEAGYQEKYYFDRLGMLWRLALKTSIEHINFKSQDAHCVYMGGTTTLANIEIGLFWLANWGYLTFWKKRSGRIFCELSLSLSLYKQLKDQNWSRIERQRVWYGPHVWISDVWWCLDRMNNYTFWNATILPCFQRSQRSSNHISKKTMTRTWSFTCSHGSCWNNT